MQIPFVLNTNMCRTVACNKSPVQHQCMDMMGLCIMLYVFFVTKTITNTTRLSLENKDSLCVLSSACSALNFRHNQSVLILFHILTIFCCCQTQDGVSPAHAARWKGHTEVVDLLVQAGADIHLASTEEVYVSTHTVSSSVAAVVETNVRLINPRCTGVRVTVLGLSVCVCVCVCVSVYLNSRTTGNEAAHEWYTRLKRNIISLAPN